MLTSPTPGTRSGMSDRRPAKSPDVQCSCHYSPCVSRSDDELGPVRFQVRSSGLREEPERRVPLNLTCSKTLALNGRTGMRGNHEGPNCCCCHRGRRNRHRNSDRYYRRDQGLVGFRYFAGDAKSSRRCRENQTTGGSGRDAHQWPDRQAGEIRQPGLKVRRLELAFQRRSNWSVLMKALSSVCLAFGLAVAPAVLAVNPACSDELKIFGSRVTKMVVEDIGPQFERATGHHLVVVTDVAAVMKRRIEAGEPFDLAVLVNFQADELIKKGKIVTDTRSDLMKAGIGVAVRRGARIPDITTVEAFKQTLLAAKSITYLKEGASSIYL